MPQNHVSLNPLSYPSPHRKCSILVVVPGADKAVSLKYSKPSGFWICDSVLNTPIATCAFLPEHRPLQSQTSWTCAHVTLQWDHPYSSCSAPLAGSPTFHILLSAANTSVLKIPNTWDFFHITSQRQAPLTCKNSYNQLPRGTLFLFLHSSGANNLASDAWLHPQLALHGSHFANHRIAPSSPTRRTPSPLSLIALYWRETVLHS